MDSQNGPRTQEKPTQISESGGSLLVVGTVPENRFAQVIKWALRQADTASRKQIIVTTMGDEPEIDAYLPSDGGIKPPGEAQIIHITEQKEVNPIGTDSTDEQIPIEVIDSGKIDLIGQKILHTVESFEANNGELDPAELMVSFQKLSDLIDIHGQEGVFRLVHLLNHLFKERSAIALYHLPVERESGVVRQFEPLFDYVIDLRLENGNLEGRFPLRKGEETSQWVSL